MVLTYKNTTADVTNLFEDKNDLVNGNGNVH